MDTKSNNTLPHQSSVKRRRRQHTPEFRTKVLAACNEPESSVARVAQQYQLNANLVHKWRRLYQAGHQAAPQSTGFIPVPLADSPSDVGHCVTFIMGKLTIQWPISHIDQATHRLKTFQS